MIRIHCDKCEKSLLEPIETFYQFKPTYIDTDGFGQITKSLEDDLTYHFCKACYHNAFGKGDNR